MASHLKPVPGLTRESFGLCVVVGTILALTGQMALFWSGAAGEGLGWGLSLLGWLFIRLAPLTILMGVGLALSGSTHTSKPWLTLGCAAAAIPLDAWIWLSPAFTPRGPLG